MESVTESALSSPSGRRKAARGDPLKSRVTNGKILIAGVDQRLPYVRRCRDILREHIADLGGADNCSAAERSIIRRASVMTVELERLETKFASAGEASPDDLDLYQRAAANLRRLLEAVGLQRRSRDVTPSLQAYLVAKAGESVVEGGND
jgi:hypothetical protein